MALYCTQSVRSISSIGNRSLFFITQYWFDAMKELDWWPCSVLNLISALNFQNSISSLKPGRYRSTGFCWSSWSGSTLFSSTRWIQMRKFYELKSLIIFLPINLNMCFACSKEPFHWDCSFEYPHHMFWMRNKENNFPIHTLIWRPDPILKKYMSGLTDIYSSK